MSSEFTKIDILMGFHLFIRGFPPFHLKLDSYYHHAKILVKHFVFFLALAKVGNGLSNLAWSPGLRLKLGFRFVRLNSTLHARVTLLP